MKNDIKEEIEMFILSKIDIYSKHISHLEQRKEWEKAHKEFCAKITEE
jgi:hypothetical protein